LLGTHFYGPREFRRIDGGIRLEDVAGVSPQLSAAAFASAQCSEPLSPSAKANTGHRHYFYSDSAHSLIAGPLQAWGDLSLVLSPNSFIEFCCKRL